MRGFVESGFDVAKTKTPNPGLKSRCLVFRA